MHAFRSIRRVLLGIDWENSERNQDEELSAFRRILTRLELIHSDPRTTNLITPLLASLKRSLDQLLNDSGDALPATVVAECQDILDGLQR